MSGIAPLGPSVPVASETQRTTEFPDPIVRGVTPLSLWGDDALVYRSIIALAIAALPLVALANWLSYGTPWGPQLTLAAAVFVGALACYALSNRGMRDTAAALMIGVIWLGATIFALGTEFGIHSSVIYLYLPCLLYGVLFFGVTFASVELVLTIAALLLMFWAEERGAIGGMRAFTEHSSNLNYLTGIIATCIGTLVVGVVYHRRVASEAARVVAGAEQLRLAMESAQDAQVQLQTAHAALQHMNGDLAAQGRSRDVELARTKRDLDVFHDVISKDFSASLRAFRQAIARPNDGTEARLLRELDRMEAVVGALEELGRHGLPPLQRVRLDLSDLVHEEVRQLRTVRELANVRFDIDAGLQADGDPRLISALLHHLVRRGARACRAEASPLVHFGSGSHEGRAGFFFHDNGPGMDAAQREQLFRPLQRNGERDEDTVDIGIVSARRIVERHGGELIVDSQPNHGTTIFFFLPRP